MAETGYPPSYEPLSDAEEAAIRERLNAATPGPYMAVHNPDDFTWLITTVAEDEEGFPVVVACRGHGYADMHAGDADFLAHSWEDTRRLLAEVQALYVTLGRTVQELRTWRGSA
jgi:hypothetical protein